MIGLRKPSAAGFAGILFILAMSAPASAGGGGPGGGGSRGGPGRPPYHSRNPRLAIYMIIALSLRA
jgi:hypothetical protein